MKPRDRVGAALDHKEPDRPPFQATVAPETAAKLRAEMQLESIPSRRRFGAGIAHELEITLQQDVLVTSVGFSTACEHLPPGGTDEWGVGWRSAPYATRAGVGHRGIVATHPLADTATLSQYCPPNPDREQLYAHATHTMFSFHDDYWIVGATAATILDTARALRGHDQLQVDFTQDPDIAEAILEIPYRYHRAAAHRLVRMGVDMILLGDDLAAESGLLVSVQHWRRFIKPRLAELIGSLKAINRQLKVAFRSGGDFQPVVPELVEIGVDVLYPVHPIAIDLPGLKRAYARKLSLWGTLDARQTLELGTPVEVRRQVRMRAATLGARGGLIIGPAGRVGLEVPPENLWAMIEEATGERLAPVT